MSFLHIQEKIYIASVTFFINIIGYYQLLKLFKCWLFKYFDPISSPVSLSIYIPMQLIYSVCKIKLISYLVFTFGGQFSRYPTNFYFHDFFNNNLFYSLTKVIPSDTKILANNIEN